ncbi:MAG: hypothetical protein JWO93_1037 [Micrococcaceae bacterium]|nr:hypothetical protein [Micrococcaceae bacterium]
MTVPWQQVFAALANDRLRQVYAEWLLGIQGGGTEAEVQKLATAGLLEEGGGGYRVAAGVFRDTLAAAGKPQPTGIDRFFQDGRIQGIPRRPDQRDELLGHLAIRLFGSEEVLAEAEVNRLLATVTSDVPSLRRALVDFGYLRRDPDGSQYWRSA